MPAAGATRAAEPCPACSETGATRLASGEPPLPGEDAYTWWRCGGCASHFALPRRAMDYEQGYATHPTYRLSEADLSDALRAIEECSDDHLNRMLADRLLRQEAGAGRSLLDVGAGSGFLLALGARYGFRVSGVEPSSLAREFIARHVPGAQVFASLEQAPGPYSHVSALEVLEHVEEPLGLLRSLREKLGPDGTLLLSVPNVERLYWRVLNDRGGERRFWQAGGVGDTAPHHLTRFSRRGLELLLRRAGFGSVHVGYSPQEAITFAILGLGAANKWRLRVAGLEIPIPFAFLRGYLTNEIAHRMWQADESVGFYLIGLACPGEGRAEHLERSFLRARDEVVERARAYASRDVLKILWDERRSLGRAVRGALARLSLKRNARP